MLLADREPGAVLGERLLVAAELAERDPEVVVARRHAEVFVAEARAPSLQDRAELDDRVFRPPHRVELHRECASNEQRLGMVRAERLDEGLRLSKTALGLRVTIETAQRLGQVLQLTGERGRARAVDLRVTSERALELGDGAIVLALARQQGAARGRALAFAAWIGRSLQRGIDEVEQRGGLRQPAERLQRDAGREPGIEPDPRRSDLSGELDHLCERVRARRVVAERLLELSTQQERLGEELAVAARARRDDHALGPRPALGELSGEQGELCGRQGAAGACISAGAPEPDQVRGVRALGDRRQAARDARRLLDDVRVGVAEQGHRLEECCAPAIEAQSAALEKIDRLRPLDVGRPAGRLVHRDPLACVTIEHARRLGPRRRREAHARRSEPRGQPLLDRAIPHAGKEARALARLRRRPAERDREHGAGPEREARRGGRDETAPPPRTTQRIEQRAHRWKPGLGVRRETASDDLV